MSIPMTDAMIRQLMATIELQHYSTDKIKDNWKVMMGGYPIGYLHDDPVESGCIGGSMDDWTETPLFDAVSELASQDLKARQSIDEPWFMKHVNKSSEEKITESLRLLKEICGHDKEHALYEIANLLQTARDELDTVKDNHRAQEERKDLGGE